MYIDKFLFFKQNSKIDFPFHQAPLEASKGVASSIDKRNEIRLSAITKYYIEFAKLLKSKNKTRFGLRFEPKQRVDSLCVTPLTRVNR